MRTSQIITEIEQARQSIIRFVNNQFSELVTNLEILDGAQKSKTNVDRLVPLGSDPKIFSKEKPVALIVGNERISVASWKSLYLQLLTRCSQDPCYLQKMMDLRGVTVGKGRNFLSSKAEGMTHPKEIADDLYAETHYSSSQLMRILVQRIMDVIQYDYSNISILMRA